MNSVHTCRGLNSARRLSTVIVDGSRPIRSALRWNLSIGSLEKSTCSTFVGGIRQPQQVGQSGQPMPDPVTRTIAPTNINTSTETKAAVASF